MSGAAEELPKLIGRFRQRKVKRAKRTFLTEARNMVALARANQEAFTRLGMPEPLLDELNAHRPPAPGTGTAAR